ncbi:hypothetical protein DFA_05462 [Cavenderia fasciculata]|uniref:Uncharacterized protein n=1 Tax=Cavenderia fasciculata TaxID=261658 RepID=F4PLA8_CACFS|nr:uncharacterized protein DFA_05462 [Cavenderia fasciculata]EGG23330.1 hypothetical protein DFA_05462 [Cavenderia fasciculata]|eukprot:XP_004361181.1 hypothetical protein DFA_05462 [Cavenderia fasciculata]
MSDLEEGEHEEVEHSSNVSGSALVRLLESYLDGDDNNNNNNNTNGSKKKDDLKAHIIEKISKSGLTIGSNDGNGESQDILNDDIFDQIVSLLEKHSSVEESIDLLMIIFGVVLDSNSTNTNDIFNILSKDSKIWKFIKLVYSLISRDQESPERLSIITSLSSLLNVPETPYSSRLFQFFFSFLMFEDNPFIINNGIGFLGSLLSLSLSLQLDNILFITSNWINSFKKQDKPNILISEDQRTDEKVEISSLYQILFLNDFNPLTTSVQELDKMVDLKKEKLQWSPNARKLKYWLSNFILVDHLYLNDSIVFEELPRHCYPLSLLLLDIMVYYLIHPIPADEMIQVDGIDSSLVVNKLLVILIEYWIPSSGIALIRDSTSQLAKLSILETIHLNNDKSNLSDKSSKHLLVARLHSNILETIQKKSASITVNEFKQLINHFVQLNINDDDAIDKIGQLSLVSFTSSSPHNIEYIQLLNQIPKKTSLITTIIQKHQTANN